MARLFSSEDIVAVVDMLVTRYGRFLDHERFEVGGRLEPGFVELAVALVREDRTFRYDIEVRVPLARDGLTPSEGREVVLDFLGWYLDPYFASGRDTLLPLDYQPYEFGEHKVWARGDVSNPCLDELADEIIAAGVPLAPEDPRHKRG
jgi:hypothetical protein